MKINYWAGWLLSRFLSRIPFRVRVFGLNHLPESGGFILASNHISYFDPPMVGSQITRELYFFGKKELFRYWPFGAILRSVNALPVKRGVIDREAVKLAVNAIERGFGLTIFPEGTRSRSDRFLSPKPGIGLLARTALCPIVPCYIEGFNRMKDCLLGKRRAVIIYGEPLSSDWIKACNEDKEGYLTIASTVMARITELKDQVSDIK